MRNGLSRSFWGLTLIVVGFLLMGNQLGWVTLAAIDVWPSLLIWVGLFLLVGAFHHPEGQGITGGLVLTAIGGYWLGKEQGWMKADLFVPVLLIALGFGMILRAIIFRTS
jgi:hypothetical protein